MPIFECSRCNEMTYSAFTGAAQPCAQCGSSTVRTVEGAFAEARSSVRDLAPGDHATLVFDDVQAVAPFCARYLTEGLDAGEHVVAALPDDLREAVGDLLAPDVAVMVDWRAASDVYGDFDADRVAAAYEEMIASEPRTTRILAGLDADCAAGVEPAEFDRYERLSHRTVTEYGANVVCIYDARVLPPEFVDVAERRHTLAVTDGVPRRNAQFEYEPV